MYSHEVQDQMVILELCRSLLTECIPFKVERRNRDVAAMVAVFTVKNRDKHLLRTAIGTAMANNGR
jgi:hypothetical protein